MHIYVALVKRTDQAGLLVADLIRFDELRILQALGRMSFLATTKAPPREKGCQKRERDGVERCKSLQWRLVMWQEGSEVRILVLEKVFLC